MGGKIGQMLYWRMCCVRYLPRHGDSVSVKGFLSVRGRRASLLRKGFTLLSDLKLLELIKR